MDAEYITIPQAARLSGYTSPTNLHAAARSGRLRTVSHGPHARLTTHAWLEEYLATLKHPNARLRGHGQERKSQNAGEDADGT